MKTTEKIIAKNKKVEFNYEIMATYEAGLVLLGSEVKSVRQGKVNLSDSYGHISQGEIFLRNCHISPYDHASYANHDPLREKKLLLHSREIKKLIGKIKERGFTLVPVSLYLKDGRIKISLALVRGKRTVDKSKDIKERDLQREMERDFKSKNLS